MTYQVESGKELKVELPLLTQEPDCGLELFKYRIEAIQADLTKEQVLSAVTLDQDFAAVIIKTNEVIYINEQVSFKIVAEIDDISAEMFFEIKFEAKPTEFD